MSIARARWPRAKRRGALLALLPVLVCAVARSARASLCAGETSQPSARGAWYRKVESVPDPEAVGLEGRVFLPRVSADPARWMPKRPGDPSWWEGPLDRPSVYVGLSQGGTEVDAGLSWERALDGQGKPATEEDGSPAFAFRPFWRVTRGGASTYGPLEKPAPALAPGADVRLELDVTEDGLLELTVAPEGGTRWVSKIPAPGVPLRGGPPRTFKRVNAIDQFRFDAGVHRGNEGFDALPTRAYARGGRWLSAALRRADGSLRALAGEACRVSIGGEPSASRPPAVTAGAPTAYGGETIDLQPGL